MLKVFMRLLKRLMSFFNINELNNLQIEEIEK